MDIQVFKNSEFGEVRTLTINNEPYFVGKDVADILGYANASKALADHVDDEDKLNNDSLSSLGQRGGWLINESGLYSLILSSKLPKAKQFKRWVTSEVLPSIRQSGGYIAGQEQMDDFELVSRALLVVNKQLELRNKQVAELEAEKEQNAPKVLFADAITASDSTILIRDLAKLLKQNGVDIGEKRMYKWLRSNGYICKHSTAPTQRAMEMGLFEIHTTLVVRGDGLPKERHTTKVTTKGQSYFVNKFLSNKE